MEKQIFSTRAVTDTRKTDAEGVGTLRWVDSRLYRWVLNKNAEDLTVGEIAYHKAADTSNLFNYIYDRYAVADASDEGLMAGVVMATTLEYYDSSDATKRCYGWVLVLGDYASVAMYASGITAIAAGDLIKGSDTESVGYGIQAAPDIVTQTQTALTDSSTGVTTTTLAALTPTATYNSADFNLATAHVASLAAQLALVKADVAALIAAGGTNQRGIIAIGALASTVTIATAVRGFVRCL